jgi:hypothetical protein
VFFLCYEDARRPIEATNVGFWMFLLRIKNNNRALSEPAGFFSLAE